MKRILAIALVLAAPLLSLAHSTGLLLEKTVGNYFVDVGVMPHGLTGMVVAKDTIYFEFKLYTADKNSQVEFNQLKVVLAESGQEVLNKTLEINGTYYMNYAFEKGGEYTLLLSFIKDGKELVATDFPISVGQVQTKWQKALSVAWQALPIIIGWPLVMYYGFKEWRRRKLEKRNSK